MESAHREDTQCRYYFIGGPVFDRRCQHSVAVIFVEECGFAVQAWRLREPPFPAAAEVRLCRVRADSVSSSLECAVANSDAPRSLENVLGRVPRSVLELGQQELSRIIQRRAILLVG